VVKLSTSARSPLSPTRWPKDSFRWWASLGTALLVGVAMLGPAVAVLVAFTALAPGSTHMDPVHPALTWPLLIVQFVSNGAAVAVLLVLLPVIARAPLATLGLRAPRASDLVWGLGGAVAMVFAVDAIGALQDVFVHVKPDEVQVAYLRNARGSELVGYVLAACVAAPFTEELIFRGFVFNALRRYMPAALAVLLSAIVFGLVHWQTGNAGALVPLAAGGVVLAVVYYRSGSLVASMITHALFNGFTVTAVLVFHQTA
jgi:membrane protease YdiL (CAAX protease family)